MGSLLTQELRNTIPKLYSTEEIKLEDKIAVVRWYQVNGKWTWYAVEGQPIYDEDRKEIDYEFFGYVAGNFPEWGYFTLSELEACSYEKMISQGIFTWIERDENFKPTKMSEILARFRE